MNQFGDSHSLIRRQILNFYQGTGVAPSLEDVATRLGLDPSDLILQLHRESPLDDIASLTIEEARSLINQFAGLSIFAKDVEKAISDFDIARRQIQEIERKARGD